VSSISSEAGLLVAAFQLFAVSQVTGAIRAADLESGDVETPSGIIEKPESAPTPDAEPDPSPQIDRYDNGPRLGPATESLLRSNCYAPPRSTLSLPLRPLPRHEPRIIPVCDLPSEPVAVPSNPIEPPWKILPWMDRAPQRVLLVREIKPVPTGSDMSLRGKMIDVVV
jgi:hypothetical protein